MPNAKASSTLTDFNVIIRDYEKSVLDNARFILSQNDINVLMNKILSIFKKRGKYVTGELYNSLKFETDRKLESDGNITIALFLLAAHHWEDVDKGVSPSAMKKEPTLEGIETWIKVRNVNFLNQKNRDRNLRKGLIPMTASWEKDGRKGVNRLFGVTRQTTKSYAEQILETIKKYGLMGSKYEYMGLEKGQGGLNIPRYKKHSTYLFDDINEMVMDYIKKNYPDWLQNIMDKSKVVLDIKFREKLNKYLKELDVVLDKDFKELDRGLKNPYQEQHQVLDKDFKELDRGLKTKVPHVDRAISDLYKLHDGNIGKLKGVYKEFLDVKNKTEKYIKLERIDATTLKEFIRKLDNILKG